MIVILEPDAIARADCLTAGDRADRHASPARAARTPHTANPGPRGADSGDGVVTKVSNRLRPPADGQDPSAGDSLSYAEVPESSSGSCVFRCAGAKARSTW